MVEPSFVRGHGRRRAQRTTVSPTLWTPFPFPPVHAWLVWCWPACWGLFTVKWRLQLRCCWFAVVLAASWSAWFAWVPLRCCRWSFRRMLFMQLACPCRCWSVASWFVQVWCRVVCYRCLVAFVLAACSCSAVFVGTIVGRRGAPWCCQLVGRRFRFAPCTPGWFGIGRLACGLFTVRWRLQLRCCWFAVVLAASWSAWFAWVPLRCCRWSFRRMLFMQLACPCRCWSVASWFVQV